MIKLTAIASESAVLSEIKGDLQSVKVEALMIINHLYNALEEEQPGTGEKFRLAVLSSDASELWNRHQKTGYDSATDTLIIGERKQ